MSVKTQQRMSDGSILETGDAFVSTEKGNLLTTYTERKYSGNSFIKRDRKTDGFGQTLEFQSTSPKEALQVTFGFGSDRPGEALKGKADFMIDGEKASFFDVTDKTFLKMAEYFPARPEGAEIDRDLETRMMAIDPFKCPDEKSRQDLMKSLESLSNRGYKGATLSLLNMCLDEYNSGSLNEEQKLAAKRQINKLSQKVKEGDTTGYFEKFLDRVMDKNEEFQPLTTRLARKTADKISKDKPLPPSKANGSVLQVTKDGNNKIDKGTIALALGAAGLVAVTTGAGLLTVGGVALATGLIINKTFAKEVGKGLKSAKNEIKSTVELLRQKKGRV